MKKCNHTSDNDYCASCGSPQGSMREMIEDEMLLDDYPSEVIMKMTPSELRRAIRFEKGL